MAQKSNLRFTREETAETVDPKEAAGFSKKKRMAYARAHDEATGKVSTRLHFDEPVKQPSKLTHEVARAASSELHHRVEETEDDNSGVEAVHGAEKTAEGSVRLAKLSNRSQKLRAHRKVEKAEREADHAAAHTLSHHQPLSKPSASGTQQQKPLSSHPISRWQQKRTIRRQYAVGTVTQGASSAQNTVRGVAQRAKKASQQFFQRSKKTWLLFGALFLMIALVLNGLSSCAPLVECVMQSLVIAAYPAEERDLLAAERHYSRLEDELRYMMEHYDVFYPDYDEYNVEADDIWHDPHVLMSLISARMNGEWTIDNVYGYLLQLFEKQYILTEEIVEETRYRKEWVTREREETDPDTGETKWVSYQVEEDVPYTYRICNVTLKNFNLSHLPFYVLSREGVGRYAMYISVLGMREDLFRGNPYASELREPGEYDIPEEALEDETFRKLIEEAEKYIGYPYVWGGDSPETSFDCSGFISYVFANSGVRDVGRLGATSLYGACQPISPDEAKPGDLIFFEGTIAGEEGITHVGLYVGGNHMLHCGSPIGYADLTESYWQNHYYGYGRLN